MIYTHAYTYLFDSRNVCHIVNYLDNYFLGYHHYDILPFTQDILTFYVTSPTGGIKMFFVSYFLSIIFVNVRLHADNILIIYFIYTQNLLYNPLYIIIRIMEYLYA